MSEAEFLTKDQVNERLGFTLIKLNGDIDREQLFGLMKSAKQQVANPPATISVEDGVRMSETIALLGSLLLAVLLINDMYMAAFDKMDRSMSMGTPEPKPTIN